MKRKLFSLLVLLMTAVSGAWAQGVLNIVVSGTSATIKYDGNASNNPYLGGDEWKQSEFPWDMEFTIRPTITTVTIDGSCKNFSGTSLRSLFIGFSGLTTINGLDNLNTANVQDMEYMFADCSSLTSLDLSSLNTARLTTMSNMFAYCSKLTTVDLSSWNTENVEVTSSLFFNCSELTTVDLSSWNTAKVWNTGYMFYNCPKLENIYVGDGWSTAKVTQSDDMFTGCTKLLSMNTANPATNKTNAHTGDGGYLKVKPAGDYAFTVAPCEHGSGTVKFFVDEKEVKGANEGDLITMTVTPDEGYVVGSVSANAYTTWAGARRKAPAAISTIPMLGNVTLTHVEGKANTWTFTMPAASVLVSAAYIPVAAFAPAEPSGTLAPTAAEGVIAGEDKAIIVAGTVANIPETTNPQGTVKYFVTDNKDMTAEQAAKANGWVETLPTAAGYTGSYADDFQVYVWYYIQAATGYADSKPQRIEVTVQSNLFDLALNPANANTIEAGKATVTVGGTDATVTEGKLQGVKMGIEVKLKAKDGYKFRKVEVKKKAAGKPVSEITPDDIFKVIASDGIIYDNIAAAESAGTVAQGLIVYVGSNTGNENYNHGLALALKDENSNTQGEAINACNAKNTSTPIVDALWILPSQGQWNTMFTAAGGDWKLRDCFSSAGGNNMVKDGEYWSSSGDSEWIIYWMFSGYDWEGTWGDIQPYYNYSCNVRACIVF